MSKIVWKLHRKNNYWNKIKRVEEYVNSLSQYYKDITILQFIILSKLTYRLKESLLEISVECLMEISKMSLNFIWKHKITNLAKVILKNKTGRYTQSDMQIY
jgi:hypothetical protein